MAQWEHACRRDIAPLCDAAAQKVPGGCVVRANLSDWSCRCRESRDRFASVRFLRRRYANRSKIRWLLAAWRRCASARAFTTRSAEIGFPAHPIPRSAESIARGRQLFAKDCAVCHGAEGPAMAWRGGSLPRRPDDLSKIAPPPIFPMA